MSAIDLTDEIIADTLSQKYGRKVAISPVTDSVFKAELEDATLKFLAPTPEGKDGFLLVSGAGNPHLIDRAVSNIEAARDAVSVPVAAPILQAVTVGETAGRGFAVWPKQRPFVASNRIMRRVRNRLYARRITQWIISLCHETLTPADPEDFLGCLQVIANDTEFPDDMRRDAEHAATRVRSDQWRPVHCFHHGDFWTGNLLLPENPEDASFYVIDWAGMQQQGYPFLDLMQMLGSLRCGQRFNAQQINSMCARIGCEMQDVVAYVLSAYGHIGSNLEYFPVERYRAAALEMYRFTKTF